MRVRKGEGEGRRMKREGGRERGWECGPGREGGREARAENLRPGPGRPVGGPGRSPADSTRAESLAPSHRDWQAPGPLRFSCLFDFFDMLPKLVCTVVQIFDHLD